MEWKKLPDNFENYYDEINPDQPYVTQLLGGYRGSLDTGEDMRPYWLYYPENMEFSSRSVTLLLPENAEVESFLETSGWKELADQERFLLMAAGGKEDSWGKKSDKKFLELLLKELKNRKYMDTKQEFAYYAAYGASVPVAFRFILRNPFEYAGAVFAGSPCITADEMEEISSQPFMGGDLKLGDIPCPILFATDKSSEDIRVALEHWKKINQTEEEAYVQGDMEIWFPDQTVFESYTERQHCAKVQLLKTDVLYSEDSGRRFWKFLSGTVRGLGVNDGNLHVYRTPEQLGLTKREGTVDGYKRFWYEYVPERGHILTDGSFPLVLYCHGGSASPISDAYYHEWMAVAKERGFILAMPMGTMRRFPDMMPHPAWNASDREDHMDDVKFIKLILKNICERYPIDTRRIYVNGHSMGSVMAQRLALLMPDVFAAVAANSGVIKGGFMGSFEAPDVRVDLDIPIWYNFGERDYGGGTPEVNPDIKAGIEYWKKRYHLEEQYMGTWRDGRYLNREWCTEEGIPMLRFTTVLEKPHAITPADAFFYYDQFFCAFQRDAEGMLYYKGKKKDLKTLN